MKTFRIAQFLLMIQNYCSIILVCLTIGVSHRAIKLQQNSLFVNFSFEDTFLI